MSSNNNSSSRNVSESGSTRDRCNIYSTCNNVSFLPGTSTLVTEWSLVCGQGWALNVIFMVQMVGVVLGASLIGLQCDRVRQRIRLFCMVKIYISFTFLAESSKSWEMFATVRFLIGIAVGGILATGYAILLEFTSEFWRGVLGTMPIWSIGTASFSIAVILLKDWRHVYMLSAIVSCLALLPVIWIPESFRWLAVKGRDTQAWALATKMAKMNKRPLPSLKLVASMIVSERRRAEVENSTRYSYLDLFRDTLVRKRSIFFGLGYVFHRYNLFRNQLQRDSSIRRLLYKFSYLVCGRACNHPLFLTYHEFPYKAMGFCSPSLRGFHCLFWCNHSNFNPRR